jgi:hypothetical protein
MLDLDNPCGGDAGPVQERGVLEGPDCLYPTYNRKDVSEVMLLDGFAACVTSLAAYLLPAA